MERRFLSKRYWKSKSTAMSASEGKAAVYADMINLSIGDTDLVTDERIIDAAFRDAKLGHTKYTHTRGYPELRQEIATFYLEEYGIEINDEEIMATTSGCIAMFLALEAILDDGDEVIVPTPCFTPYFQQIELARGATVQLETFEEDGFQVKANKLEALITPRTKALIVNTPTNPTGACMSRETLQAIADVANKHDLLIIADDIYTLYAYQAPFAPIVGLPGMRERTITINSFSKNFLMTGWRIGNIVAPPHIIDTIRQINENVAFTCPSISQRAAIYALRNRKAIQPAIFAEYQDRMLLAAKRINAMRNISVLPPQGSFYLFPNVSETGLSSAQVAEQILQEAHVAVLPGNAFGQGGEGYLRIACTCSKERLNEAFDRIAAMSLFKP